ncbi:MAG TPA: class I SAM-dependent rRNA methyltransferase [Longimicrobiales bacterium]|nr:class I SAM-dependent rRNA methyltransferase [Longimicrobiales bacterium]
MSGSTRRLAVHLNPRAEKAVKAGHPWVFADGIRRQSEGGVVGDLAVIFDRANRFAAIGLYDPASPIRVRVLHHGSPETIDRDWFVARIRDAYGRRQPLERQDTTGFRWVHGENDGLPGLIADRYGSSIVVKLYSLAWAPHLGAVLAGISAVMDPERVVLRLSRAVQRDAAAAPEAAVHGGEVLRDGAALLGGVPAQPVLFKENGITFEADLLRGQKTGFFLDQRDNRARVEKYAAGASVLNVFAYTGGFSVYAARGGAHSVTSLDASAPALVAAERNFQHNRSHPAVAAARHRALVGDAFELLPELHARGEQFDIVILDPPSFAKARAEVNRALASYARIVRMGLDLVAHRGLLVAASCSSRISADRFRHVVEETARGARRPLRVEQQTGHALDHPIAFAEGAYLKCIFARVGGHPPG